MDIDLADVRRNLDARDQPQAKAVGGGAASASPSVVSWSVRERTRTPLRGGRLHHPGGRVDAVRGGAVEVEVAGRHQQTTRSQRVDADRALGRVVGFDHAGR